MSSVAEQFQKRAIADEDSLEDIMRDFYTAYLGGVGPCSVIDGGAHRGLHTYPLAALPNCRRVYAVEANQQLAAELSAELKGHSAGARVVVTPAALQEDAARESVTFMLSESHLGRSGISSIFQKDESVSFVPVIVPATTIDKLAADRADPVRFIKLDLEGGEWNAVRGAIDVMAKDRPVFVMEHSVHSPEINNYTRGEYLALFDARGYQPLTFAGEPITADNMFYLWYLWAAPKEKVEEVSALLLDLAKKTLSNAARN